MTTTVIDFENPCEHAGPAVVAIGVFDGVHRGHQALIRDTIELSRERGVRSVVATFDRDPDRVVQPGAAAPQLLELADKVDFISDLGPDTLLVIPFDAGVAAMPPAAFIDEIVRAACDPVRVVVGSDFRFGRGAEGTVDVLAALGAERGFDVYAHDLVNVDGAPVTSTRIRGLVAKGDVTAAARLLGRSHRVRGRTVRGRGEGALLGVPTANVHPHSYAAVPADGVYAARVGIGERRFDAGVSVGVPPTFPGAADVVEAHLLDFRDGDLHGLELTVDFVARLRDQRRFDDVNDLTAAISRDLGEVRDILGREQPW